MGEIYAMKSTMGITTICCSYQTLGDRIGDKVEAYVLMAVCLATWGLSVVLFKYLMKDSEYAFVIGSIVGLVLAVASGGAYYQHLAGTSF